MLNQTLAAGATIQSIDNIPDSGELVVNIYHDVVNTTTVTEVVAFRQVLLHHRSHMYA